MKKCHDESCIKKGVYRDFSGHKFCRQHKTPGSIITGKCIIPECEKRGYYGDPKQPSLKNTAYCINHRPAIYTRIYNNCIVKDCTKTANFGAKDIKKRHAYCKDHRPIDYIKHPKRK
jgi:hypothetical protein